MAAAGPAGDDCATGRKLGSGSSLHTKLLNWLGDEAAVDWYRASVDSLQRAGQKGGEQTGPNPVDRGKPGSEIPPRRGSQRHPPGRSAHGRQRPRCDSAAPADRRDPAIVGPRGKPGRPRKRPAKLHADKAYECLDLASCPPDPGHHSRIARRGIDSSERSVGIAGSWSDPSPGCSAAAASASATSGGRTCCRGC